MLIFLSFHINIIILNLLILILIYYIKGDYFCTYKLKIPDCDLKKPNFDENNMDIL